jgi:hypothetical protein
LIIAAAAIAIAAVVVNERCAVCIDIIRPVMSACDAAIVSPVVVVYGNGGATNPIFGNPGDDFVATR